MVGSKQRYKAYPEYKYSGVEWLGKIPPHWQIWKLNHFSPIITCGVASTPEYVDDGVVFLSAQNVKNRKVDLTKGHKFISRKSHEELTKHRTPRKGDILLSRVGTVGEACVIDVDFDFSIFVSLTHLRLNNEICVNDFFIYLCASRYMESLHQAVTLVGGGVGNLNVNDFREYQLPIPPVREQLDIIKFLDYETAKIDTLIEKQQRLIELLIEKRQAVISHAVTKGLNPDVPMKDSGVEWLGEVPEHWEKKSINYLLGHIVDNRGRTPPIVDSGIPMAEVSQVAGRGIYTSNDFSKYVTQSSYDQFVRSEVQENDVLFVTVGATFGKACLVPPNPEFFIAQNVVGFRCVKEVDPKFFMLLLSTAVFKEAISSTNKSSTIDNVKVSDLIKIRVVMPPLDEQQEIANMVLDAIDSYELLIAKAQQAIQLMQERRTALISAAVTGKIDVRDWVKPE